ncbi:MAG TPA: hypothetical protein VHK90_10590 [Thermoanaerobaculia bacterium]|nr:hypothetical protein [Thermoanaerobaculia bacterium]
MRRRRDLIVPIRDRRQRKRYLTLKNFRNAMIVLALLFVVITIRSELRGTGPGYYGRLYEKELPPPVEPRKPVEVVREEPPPVVPEATHADPMLVESFEREQWLRDHGEGSVTAQTTVGLQPRAMTAESRVAIVGGSDGVAIVQQARRKPVLSGGFGR